MDIDTHADRQEVAIEVVAFDDYNKLVEYGQPGRVLLTTLTKEFFVPRFAERDEGEREPPFEKFPWDGVSGVRPFHEIAAMIANLQSPDYATRQAAVAGLSRQPASSLPALQTAREQARGNDDALWWIDVAIQQAEATRQKAQLVP